MVRRSSAGVLARTIWAVLWALGALAAPAAEAPSTWRPSEHPAQIERSITGFTRPRRAMMVASEVPGRITAVAVEVGQRVSPDQAAAVVSIDSAQAVIARDQARSAVAAAEQAAAVAALAIRSAEAEAALRERSAARTKALADDGKLSAEELDSAVTTAALARLAAQRTEVQVAQAATAVAQARLDLVRAEDLLARHQVPAPSGWLVSARQVEPGAMVAAGTPMLRVVDTTTLVVELHLSTEELAALRALPELSLRFPRHGGRRVPAQLARLDAEFDPLTRKRRIELDLVGAAAPEAVGGLEVALDFTMPDAGGAVLVPLAFLVGPGAQRVRLQDGSEHPVTVVRRDASTATILLGSLPPDAVLTP